MQSITCTSSALTFRIADSDEQLESSEHSPLNQFSNIIFERISNNKEVSIEHNEKYYAVSLDNERKNIIIKNAPNGDETIGNNIQEILQLFFIKYMQPQKTLDGDEVIKCAIGDFVFINGTS
ncbi:MAG: hypothetical protein HAW66_04975 [Shewanella sp.]|nr:hypothetical protein [Shewanella sp.]